MKIDNDDALFAFWKTDSFPFVRGGKVVKMYADGKVQIKGYEGYMFTPIKMLPEENGQTLVGQLRTKEACYRHDINETHNSHVDEMEKFLITWDGLNWEKKKHS